MSNKKSKKNNKFPFANEIQLMKSEFKNIIDSMSDDEFLDLISFLSLCSDDIEDEDWTFDEEWEDEAEKFYNNRNNNSINFDEDDSLPF